MVTTTRRPRLRPSRPVSACSLLLRALFSCGAESRDGEQGDAWCWISCVSVGRVAGRARFGGPPARQLVLARRIRLTPLGDDQLRLRRVRSAPRPFTTTCRALEPSGAGAHDSPLANTPLATTPARGTLRMRGEHTRHRELRHQKGHVGAEGSRREWLGEHVTRILGSVLTCFTVSSPSAWYSRTLK